MELDLDLVLDSVSKVQREAADIHLHPDKHFVKSDIIHKVKDYTTAADIAVEEYQKKRLGSIFPQIGFLGEEIEPDLEKRFSWLVDPTDGTAVFATGGEYYSNAISLVDRELAKVPFVSVYQPSRARQFIKLENETWIREEIVGRDNTNFVIDRLPVRSNSRGAPELMGCAYGTSKYYDLIPGLKDKLKKVFEEVNYPDLGRSYKMIDARPASGSSSLFCCDIANGNRHFVLLYFQRAWDLAGALYARDSGCIVECGTSIDNVNGGDLEKEMASGTKDKLINISVFANKHVKEIVESRLK